MDILHTLLTVAKWWICGNRTKSRRGTDIGVPDPASRSLLGVVLWSIEIRWHIRSQKNLLFGGFRHNSTDLTIKNKLGCDVYLLCQLLEGTCLELYQRSVGRVKATGSKLHLAGLLPISLREWTNQHGPVFSTGYCNSTQCFYNNAVFHLVMCLMYCFEMVARQRHETCTFKRWLV